MVAIKVNLRAGESAIALNTRCSGFVLFEVAWFIASSRCCIDKPAYNLPRFYTSQRDAAGGVVHTALLQTEENQNLPDTFLPTAQAPCPSECRGSESGCLPSFRKLAACATSLLQTQQHHNFTRTLGQRFDG